MAKTDSIIISETDAKGIILYANDNFCHLSGYTREELIGQPHSIIRHPSMPPELFHLLWTTIKQGQVFRGVIKNRRKDGGFYWVNATIMPVFKGSDIIGYTGARHLIDDVTAAEELFKRQVRQYGWKINFD
jgi:aerotaxis receptor